MAVYAARSRMLMAPGELVVSTVLETVSTLLPLPLPLPLPHKCMNAQCMPRRECTDVVPGYVWAVQQCMSQSESFPKRLVLFIMPVVHVRGKSLSRKLCMYTQGFGSEVSDGKGACKSSGRPNTTAPTLLSLPARRSEAHGTPSPSPEGRDSRAGDCCSYHRRTSRPPPSPIAKAPEA